MGTADGSDRASSEIRKLFNRGIDRRQFLSVAGTSAAAAFLAACGLGGGSNTPQSGPNGPFKKINFFTTEDDPNTQAAVTAAAEAFSAKNPGVEIAQILMGATDRDQRILTALRAGQSVDLFEIGPDFLYAFAQAGYLHPLDDLFKAIGADQFPPGSHLVLNGHHYTFPYGSGAGPLWYRTDRIPQAPTSFDEMLSAFAGATGHGNYGAPYTVGGYLAMTIDFPAMVWQQGGDYFDPQGNVVFGSDQVTEAINRYLQLLKYSPPSDSTTTWGPFDLITNYYNGKLASSTFPGGRLGVNLPAAAPKLVPLTKVARPAYGPVVVNYSRWSQLAIDNRCQYPDLAMQFMQFLFTGDNGVTYANSVPGQLIPAIKSTREAALKAPNAFVQAHSDWVSVLDEMVSTGNDTAGPMGQVATGTFKPYDGPQAPWLSQAFGFDRVDMKMLQKIVLQGESVKTAQAEAVDAYKAIVSDYKSKHPNWRPPV